MNQILFKKQANSFKHRTSNYWLFICLHKRFTSLGLKVSFNNMIFWMKSIENLWLLEIDLWNDLCFLICEQNYLSRQKKISTFCFEIFPLYANE